MCCQGKKTANNNSDFVWKFVSGQNSLLGMGKGILIYQNSSSFTSFDFFLYSSRNLSPPPRQQNITQGGKLLPQEAQPAIWKAVASPVQKKACINASYQRMHWRAGLLISSCSKQERVSTTARSSGYLQGRTIKTTLTKALLGYIRCVVLPREPVLTLLGCIMYF